MSEHSKIEWTDSTWNPIRGVKGRHHCTKISPGCQNCYAAAMNKRFSGLDYVKGYDTFRMDEKALTLPIKWRKPRKIFVCSMTDLFHEDMPDEFIEHVWALMAVADWHTFQILTKRPERMRRFLVEEDHWDRIGRLVVEHSPFAAKRGLDRRERGGTIYGHVWLGVTAENQQYADERIPLLLQTPAAVRFVSYEPALGPVDFSKWIKLLEFAARWEKGHTPTDLDRKAVGALAKAAAKQAGWARLDWIICGGESGPKARVCCVPWIRSVVQQCKAAGVACFVKQLGAHIQDRNDAGWDGDEPEAWNEDHPNGYLETYQGAPVRVRLHSRKGADWNEWPEDLRVRELPKGGEHEPSCEQRF